MNFKGTSDNFTPGDCDFTSFEQSPDQAILLWLLNAGLDVTEWISRLPDALAEEKLRQEEAAKNTQKARNKVQQRLAQERKAAARKGGKKKGKQADDDDGDLTAFVKGSRGGDKKKK